VVEEDLSEAKMLTPRHAARMQIAKVTALIGLFLPYDMGLRMFFSPLKPTPEPTHPSIKPLSAVHNS
jgi:hypothetical protein